MKKLNLPPYKFRIEESEPGYKIFDDIRHKSVALTPEEWVRQHFVHYLTDHLNYPRSLIKIETGLKYNKMLKRSDIVTFDRTGKPFLLVECKSAENRITKNAVYQVASYNKTLMARYVVVTNGLDFLCADIKGKNIEWLRNIPEFRD